MNKIGNNSNLAFTLAEVLITLGIIGVVAAMTIPTLMQDSQNRENKAAWKKAYTEIAQTYNVIISENGFTAKGLFTGDLLGSTVLADKFEEKMKFSKTCDGVPITGGSGLGVSAEGCWHKANEWKMLDTTGKAAYTFPGAITINGRLISFEIVSTNCSTAYGNLNRCGTIFVDVNGFKNPNVIGKDIFSAILLENRTVPGGTGTLEPPSTSCIEGSTTQGVGNTGVGCSLKYLME